MFEGWNTDLLRTRLEQATHAPSLPGEWAWISPNPKFTGIEMQSDRPAPEPLVLLDDLNQDTPSIEGLDYLQTEPGRNWYCEIEGNRTMRLIVRPHVGPGQSSGFVSLRITIGDRKLSFPISTPADRKSLRYRDFEQPVPGIPETIDLPVPQGTQRILIETVSGSAAFRASVQVAGPDDWPGDTGQVPWADRIDRFLSLFPDPGLTDDSALSRHAASLACLVESRGEFLGSPMFNRWFRMVSRNVQWKWISGLTSDLGREKIDEMPCEDYKTEPGVLEVTLRNNQNISIGLPDGVDGSALLTAEVESAPESDWRILIHHDRDLVDELKARKKQVSLDRSTLTDPGLSMLLDSRSRGAVATVRFRYESPGSNVDWPNPARYRTFTRFDQENPASIDVLGPAILDIRIMTQSRLADGERIVIAAQGKQSGYEIIRELADGPDRMHQQGWAAAGNTLMALTADEVYRVVIRFEGSRKIAVAALSGTVQTVEPYRGSEPVNPVHVAITPPRIPLENPNRVNSLVLPEMRWSAPGSASLLCELNGYSTENSSGVSDSEDYGTDGFGVSAGLRKRFESVGLYLEQTIEATYLTDQADAWLPGLRNHSSTRPLIWGVRPSVDLALFSQSVDSSTEYAFRSSLDIRRTFRLGARLRLVPGIGLFLKEQSLGSDDVDVSGEIPDWRIFNEFDERNPSGMTLRLQGDYDIIDGLRFSADVRTITGNGAGEGLRNIWWNAGVEWFHRGFVIDLSYQERHPIDQTEDPERARMSGALGWYHWVTNDLMMRVFLSDRYTFDTEENTVQVGISLHFSRGRLLYDLDPNRLFCWDRIQSMAFDGGAE